MLFAYRDKLKAELKLFQQQRIIAPVTEATHGVCPMPIVVTPQKGTNRIRMCVDLSKLNCFVLREQYQSQCCQRQLLISQLVKPSILQSWLPQTGITSALLLRTASNLQHSSHCLDSLSTCMHHMAFHLLQNITTGGWQRH